VKLQVKIDLDFVFSKNKCFMKIFFYIIVGLFTFSIGFWSYLSRPFVVPVSLCEISQNAELYQSKQIKIKAYLDRVPINENEYEDFYSVYDLNSNCLTGAILEPTDELKFQLQNDENLKSLINELSDKRREDYKKRDGSRFYFAEIEIIGEISSDRTTSHSIPFIINVDKIKQISPIKFLTNEELQKLTKNINP
jgi:hypothetical protein